MSSHTLIVVIALLALGTYGLRLGGVLLARRIPAPAATDTSPAPAGDGDAPTDRGSTTGVGARVARLLPYAAVALLAALAGTAAVIESGEFAGYARPAGVVAGLVAGLLRAPFAVAVVLAAAVAAGLRLLGVP
ncbi:MAG: AzlD domain-containing protein [Micromonosporaceae bacterium]|nr:AzlD domain-containing protein [Micromonosporaceae bacterium]